MDNFFLLIFFLSLVALPYGLVRPSAFARFHLKGRKQVGAVLGGIVFASFVSFGLASPSLPEEPKSTPQTAPESPSVPDIAPSTDKPDPNPENEQEESLAPESETSQSEEVGIGASDTFVVTYVVDGDTVELENGERVRLIGIDTPERGDNFYNEARDALIALVQDKTVRMERDISKRDRYGRLLYYLYVGDTFVNLEMVRSGWATSYTYPPDVAHADDFVVAQDNAQAANLGVWGAPPPAPAPAASPQAETSPESQDCIIKGNISSEKIYHLPGCASYNKTIIDTSAGERWFCTETEALEAGWRKAKNC